KWCNPLKKKKSSSTLAQQWIIFSPSFQQLITSSKALAVRLTIIESALLKPT
ncbi:hypothetical protein L914_03960, partial [Phytophthora nicotianae]